MREKVKKIGTPALRLLASILLILGGVLSRPLEAVPYSITYAARLTDSSGVALTGTYNVRIRFYDAQTAGTQLVSGKQTSGACTGSNYITSPAADSYQVSLTSGAFSKVIYFCQSDFNTLFPDSTTTPWIEVQSAPSTDTDFSSGSVVTYPRQQFTVVPYALKVPVDGSTMTYDSSGNLKVGTVQSYQIEGTLSSGQLPSSLTPTSVSASTLQITGGTPGAGKVLTSDENGNATWQDASSSSGADTTLRNLFLPPAPTELSASPGNTQVSLSWTAPTVPFSQVPLTNYSYQVSSNGGSSWGEAVLTNSTSASTTVTGLTNGSAYVFKVAGVNGVGTGSYSSASSSVTPFAPDESFSDVVLLLQDSLNDESLQGQTITVTGDTAVSSVQSKFGGSSISFDGSGDWLTAAADSSLVFGTSPFTVEFWMYWDGTITGTPFMGVMGVHNSTGTGRYGIFMSASGIGHFIQTAFPAMSAVPSNQWVHIASTRDSSGTCRFFIDGVLKTTATDTGNLTAPQGFRVGNDFSNGRPPFSGYIDSLRITTGHARYTSDFTPPTAAFPN